MSNYLSKNIYYVGILAYFMLERLVKSLTVNYATVIKWQTNVPYIRFSGAQRNTFIIIVHTIRFKA